MDMILADEWNLEDKNNIFYSAAEDINIVFKKIKPSCVLVTGGTDFGIYKDFFPVKNKRMMIALDPYQLAAFKSRMASNCNSDPAEEIQSDEIESYAIGLNGHGSGFSCWPFVTQAFRHIDRRIAKWYSTNMSVHEDVFQGIPLGTNPSTKELVVKYRDTLKDKLLYMNFRHEREDGYELHSEIAHDFRIETWNRYKDRDWVTVESRVSKDQYCSNLARHKFAFSPEGNGVDTYRTWECLYLGVIPVVQKSEVTAWFSDLPILELTEDEWKNLDAEFLGRKYEEMKSKTYNMEKLDKRFWINRIEDEVYV